MTELQRRKRGRRGWGGGGVCEEVQGGAGVVGGVVSLGLVLHVLQCLFVLFFTWRENSRF